MGRVFKTLWTEPVGTVSKSDSQFVIPAKFGEMAFTKIRPFVVIREMQGCCLSLPLNTYGHQGTEKDRIRTGDYAAVYPMGSEPNIGISERMSKKPFPIIIEDPRERIDPRSRLNFGQVYTIQHNLKVLKIGRIPDKYLTRFDEYFMKTIAGTPAQEAPSTSVAFKSLSIGSDNNPTSSQETEDRSNQAGSFVTASRSSFSPTDSYSAPARLQPTGNIS
jgi:hypothetical protein